MFPYKHMETIEYVKNLPNFFKKPQISRINNSRFVRIKNAKLSRYVNTQSMTSSLDEFQVMLKKRPIDVIAIFEHMIM